MTATPPTDQQLNEIDTLRQAATPGPWATYDDGTGLIDIAADLDDTGHGYRCRRYIGQLEAGQIDNDPTHRDWTEEQDRAQVAADAAYIAAMSPETARALVAEVRRLRTASSEGVMRKNCACRGVVHADDCEVYLDLLRTTEPTPEPPFESLADRWEQLAEQGDTAIGHFEGPTAVTLNAEVEERGRVYRQAAADLREALETGRIPHDLMTTAELDAARPAVRPAVETGA